MGNCLVIPPSEGVKRICSSDGVGGDLEGNRPSKTALMDFEEDHVKKVLKKIKKAVRFADDQNYFGDQDVGVGDGGVLQTVRIKMVISKKELLEMIERGGVTIGDDIVSESRLVLIEGRSKANGDDDGLFDRWKPKLESIYEAI